MTTGDKAFSLHKMGAEERLPREAKTLRGQPPGKILTPPKNIPQPAQQNDMETHLPLLWEKKVFSENLKPWTWSTHEFVFLNFPIEMVQKLPSQEINVKTGPWLVIFWECLAEAIIKTL